MPPGQPVGVRKGQPKVCHCEMCDTWHSCWERPLHCAAVGGACKWQLENIQKGHVEAELVLFMFKFIYMMLQLCLEGCLFSEVALVDSMVLPQCWFWCAWNPAWPRIFLVGLRSQVETTFSPVPCYSCVALKGGNQPLMLLPSCPLRSRGQLSCRRGHSPFSSPACLQLLLPALCTRTRVLGVLLNPVSA